MKEDRISKEYNTKWTEEKCMELKEVEWIGFVWHRKTRSGELL
jgi:hypothetical protein